MSKRDARKVTIIEELLAGRFSNQQAAELLDLSIRQVQRLKAEATANGVMSLLHKNRGRKPANALAPEMAAAIIKIYQAELPNYNFCHATDVLAEEKGIYLSVSTLSRHLKAQGIRSPKAKRRPKRHRSRQAREREGELAQMDASPFDWLSNGSCLHLHGAIDDATGRILALHFDREETFVGYCELMLQMNQDGHLPREIYTDGRTIFAYKHKNKKQQLSIAEELAGQVQRQPQFARALKEVGILLIIAKSAQAKGGIERLWETLQDRLVKDMRRRGITTVEQANAFLKLYIPYYNRKFAVQAAHPQKVYLPQQDTFMLQLIFARHETRKLDSGLTFSFYGQKYCLPVYAGKQKVPASPHDTLTVVTSKHIGMQVLFKGLVIKPKPLTIQPKASIVQEKPILKSTEEVATEPKKPNQSPWFGYTKMFYSPYRRGDVSADHLSP